MELKVGLVSFTPGGGNKEVRGGRVGPPHSSRLARAHAKSAYKNSQSPFHSLMYPHPQALFLRFLTSPPTFPDSSATTSPTKLQRNSMANGVTLESLRQSLIRQEDTIIFSLIERARFPINSPTYNESYVSSSTPTFSGSLVHFVVKETEALQAKAGRYANPEEHPFFPDNLPPSVVPPYNFTEVLHPPAASININKDIWDMYFKKLLQLFAAPGDDGNYASTAASDLVCLQALSRRIHYGKLVAEVKFRESPEEYEPAIRAKDRDALMKLLTFESVEEAVKKRVAKKAMVFGQEVTLNNDDKKEKYKVDPSVVSRLYGDWIMPLTKLVQVEYLLRRLD